jgi:hypothetical protein
MGRLLILAGLALLALGVLVIVLNRFNIPLGRLPGDIVWRGKNSTVYFPWVTCLIISVVLTLLFWLFNRRP